MPTARQSSIVLLLFLSILFLVSGPAFGHKIRIFAYSEGDQILGETAFGGGRSPKNAEIIVQDAAGGKTLTTCRTDSSGNFHFPVPEEAKKNRLDLRIVINAGEGHRGEWILEAGEYIEDAQPMANTQPPDAPPARIQPPSVTVQADKLHSSDRLDEERIRKIVEEVVEKKLGPVKRMLAGIQDQGPKFQDLLGGIGYIIGLAGIVAYMKANNKNGTEK